MVNLRQLLLFSFEPAAPAEPSVDSRPGSGRHATAAPQPVPPSTAAPSTATSSPLPAVFEHPRAQREIHLQGLRVRYEFRRARRRTIGFSVGPEGLSVSAPRWVGLGEVESAVQEKGPWILRKLQEQDERNRRLDAARIEWADGVCVPFLGMQIHLCLDTQRVSTPGGALLEAGSGVSEPSRLCLGLPPGCEPERIRDVVHAWWQRQARRVFEERCRLYAERLGVSFRRLSLSSAQTRWGSASEDGSIRLNWRLIHYPMSTIDYVVVHELAHLREMNHSAAFWEVVRSVLPEYEQAQEPLKAGIPALVDD